MPLRFADGYATTGPGDHLPRPRRRPRAPGPRPRRRPARRATRCPLVRPHSECLTGDVLGSERCDCGPQLREAVERIAEAGGYLLYLRQEGRGIGLYDKLDAYALQDPGLDTYEANLALGHDADERDYTVAAQMLHALGATGVALLSNNPDKATQLARLGVRIAEQVPTGRARVRPNARYLAAKAGRGRHTLDLASGGARRLVPGVTPGGDPCGSPPHAHRQIGGFRAM